MDILLSADRVSDVTTLQALVIQTAKASSRKRERHQHVQPVIAIIQPGIEAAGARKVMGKSSSGICQQIQV